MNSCKVARFIVVDPRCGIICGMKAVVRIFRQRFSDFGCVEAFAWICICYTLYYCGLAAMLVLEAQEFIKVPLGLWVALTLILKAIIVIGVLAAAAMFVSPIRYVWRKDYSMAKKGWSDATSAMVVAFIFFLALFGFTWPFALSLSGKEELYDMHLKTEYEVYDECAEIGSRHPVNDLGDSVQT